MTTRPSSCVSYLSSCDVDVIRLEELIRRVFPMINISGLDALTHQLDQAQKAFEELDGELGVVNFDPNDPASIEAAIQEVEILVDTKARPRADNPLVSQVVGGMKEQYRQAIIDRAAAARLEAEGE